MRRNYLFIVAAILFASSAAFAFAAAVSRSSNLSCLGAFIRAI